jgi:hypothetical protein
MSFFLSCLTALQAAMDVHGPSSEPLSFSCASEQGQDFEEEVEEEEEEEEGLERSGVYVAPAALPGDAAPPTTFHPQLRVSAPDAVYGDSEPTTRHTISAFGGDFNVPMLSPVGMPDSTTTHISAEGAAAATRLTAHALAQFEGDSLSSASGHMELVGDEPAACTATSTNQVTVHDSQLEQASSAKFVNPTTTAADGSATLFIERLNISSAGDVPAAPASSTSSAHAAGQLQPAPPAQPFDYATGFITAMSSSQLRLSGVGAGAVEPGSTEWEAAAVPSRAGGEDAAGSGSDEGWDMVSCGEDK